MEKITINDIEVVSVILKDVREGPVKAIVNLSICGQIKVKGFRIMESPKGIPNKYSDPLWVVPPSYKSGGVNWRRVFHCEDRELWDEIVDKVFKEYYRLKKGKENEIPIVEDKPAI